MRVLVLGGTGMLGHQVYLACRDRCDTYVAVRAEHPMFDPARVASGVDAVDFGSVMWAFRKTRPDAVVNCIGVVKQKERSRADSILVNAVFPHRLASLCWEREVRLIHISTDCVFSGSSGGYTETDAPDPVDAYGQSKLLGEPDSSACLTLRTSFIGPELRGTTGLLEWFLSQRGQTVKGYGAAIFSGLTTPVLARVIANLLEQQPALAGVYHVGGEPISKLELLRLINETYGLGVNIEPDSAVQCNRSLDSSRFRKATGFRPPPWSEMIRELRSEEGGAA